MHRVFVVQVVLFAALSAPLSAQEPKLPTPKKEHQWLEHFVGQWETSSKGTTGPGQPPIECQGTIDSRMVGEYWVVNEMKGDVMGALLHGVQTIGYDAEKKKFVGTWIDSMTSYMWQYEGALDESGKTLTLEAEGPNFMAAGKLAKFRDSYEIKSPDRIVATSAMQGEDGEWITFMTGEITRKKDTSR